MIKQRAFLKWAGGKYSTMEHLHKVLPEGDLLIEPFVGAGNVFLNTNYKSYILMDANRDLIDLHCLLAKDGQKFIDECRALFTSENNNSERYYELRKEFNASTDPRVRAKLFVYMNRHGFNGLCRYNLSGQFNVGYGKYKKPYFPEEEMLAFYKKTRACNVTFLWSRFADSFKTIEDVERGVRVVVYCDPPYVPLSPTANFTSYCVDGFRHEDQIMLANLASATLSPVIISNHDTDVSRQLYQDAYITSFEIQRNISCVGKTRTKAKELLAIFNLKDKQ